MQLQSDLCGKPVILPEEGEVTALGAAYLAGLHVSYWQTLTELEDNWRKKREFTPTMNEEARTVFLERWEKAVSVTRMFK
jgi:glycerol kinase